MSKGKKSKSTKGLTERDQHDMKLIQKGKEFAKYIPGYRVLGVGPGYRFTALGYSYSFDLPEDVVDCLLDQLRKLPN